MTATVGVEEPNGTKKVALLYDSGAQRSFITERLAQEHLPINGAETHQFQPFNPMKSSIVTT